MKKEIQRTDKDNRPIHLVCGWADDGKLLIITVYFPDEEEWIDFKL